MAAKLISRAKSPLVHILRSSAISSVQIAAIPKPLSEAEALRRSLFDAKAQRLVAEGRQWALLNSDSVCVKTRGSRRVVDDEDEIDSDVEDDGDLEGGVADKTRGSRRVVDEDDDFGDGDDSDGEVDFDDDDDDDDDDGGGDDDEFEDSDKDAGVKRR